MRAIVLLTGLLAAACTSSGGGGDADSDVDMDTDADSDTGPSEGSIRDYCEAIVPCAQPDPPPEAIDACVDSAVGITQACIDCVLNALDCDGMTTGCMGAC